MRNLLLPGALLLNGCTELDPYTPKIRFDRLEVNSVTWDDADTNFVFAVDNPNPVEITLASFDYALAFEGLEFMSGADPDGLVLGAAGASELSLPVSLVFEELYEMVQAVRGEDTIDFELAGHFGFDTPIGLVELPYDAGGDFPALRTPSFSFDALRVDEVGLSSATLALDLAVDNDHASTLDFTDFSYAFELEGYDVGSGTVPELGAVDGANTGILTLPLEIEYGGAGYAIYEILVGGADNVNIGLAASSEVLTPFGTVPLAIDKSGRVSLSY